MIQSIEVQVISRILTTEVSSDVDTLLAYDTSYFSSYLNEFAYIQNHFGRYQSVPSKFDFLAQFPDFVLVAVPEPINYLCDKLREYKRYLILIETFNKMKELGSGDVDVGWKYLAMQCEKAASLSDENPMDIVKDSEERARLILEYSKQKRIPTGFDELDKALYGGLSTVEELFLIVARTGVGKSWACTKMMESAQKHGFPVAYYSPEMQSAYLGTRFDTWRGHFLNSSLYKGDYTQEYEAYLKSLSEDETPAFVLEDKDFSDGVSVSVLSNFVKKHGIKLLIIDGISYMKDDQRATRDQEKYKNIATGLFSLSKRFGCAVVLVVQSNREVKNKDDKGESIPDLFNTENSDAPGRVATQAIGLRQIFDKHVLDIKLLKARGAANSQQVYSYAWDVNSGNMQYLSSGSDDVSPVIPEAMVPTVSAQSVLGPVAPAEQPIIQDDDEDVEF